MNEKLKKEKKPINKDNMPKKDKRALTILGLLIALIGGYFVLISFRIVPIIPILNDFLLQNPILNQTFPMFAIGLALIYIGYLIYNH